MVEKCRFFMNAVLIGAGLLILVLIVRFSGLPMTRLGNVARAADKKQRVIVAEQFLVQDSKGRSRVVIGTTNDNPRIDFLDEQGHTRIMLSVIGEGTVLSLFDANQKTRMVLGIKQNTGPCLELFDEMGASAARFFISSYGVSLASVGKMEQVRTILTLSREKSQVSVIGKKGAGALTATLEKPFGGFMVQGPNDTLRGILGYNEEGALLGLGDDKGRLRINIATDNMGVPSLMFMNENGIPTKVLK